MKKNKFNKIGGVTLIEIVVGIVMTTIMMAAMYTSYTAVNNSYSQVTDKAKMSRSGRDVVGMMSRDIRSAGFKYYQDNLPPIEDEHGGEYPIIITMRGEVYDEKDENIAEPTDRIDIVYGHHNVNELEPFERYRISYYSRVPEGEDAEGYGGPYVIMKSKYKLDVNNKTWEELYRDQEIIGYLVDMEFVAVDEFGKRIFPPPNLTVNTDKIYKIRSIDLKLTFRSKEEFFQTEATPDRPRKTIESLGNLDRDIQKTDKYLRDSIVVTIHTRNLGLGQFIKKNMGLN